MLQAKEGIIPDEQYYHDPQIQNKEGNTVAILLAQHGIIPPKQWRHDPNLQNNSEESVAMCLASQGIIPPKYWHHLSNLQDQDGYTVAMRIVINWRMIPDIDWWHQPNLQNDRKETVAMLISYHLNVNPPKLWYHDPALQDDRGQTVAMILILNKVIPSKIWEHDKFLEDKYQYTVGKLFAYSKIIPTQQWMITEDENQQQFNNIKEQLQKYGLPIPLHVKNEELTIFDQTCYRIIPNIAGHQPNEQDEDGFTVAMILAINGMEIPKEWEHKSDIQNNYGDTVATLMVQYCKDANKLKIPQQWMHDPELTDYENTVAMKYAIKKTIPPKEWNHDKFKTNCYEKTVAQKLAENQIIPPQNWMITKEESKAIFNTIKYYLQDNNLPVPLHVKDDELSIFDQACYRIIPKLGNHKPDEQNKDGFTVAMILAVNKIKIPEEWYHDPNIKDNNGYTVALHMAKVGVAPDKQWYHDKYLRIDGKKFYTVQNLLIDNCVEVPEYWKYDFVIDKFDTTQAMKQARNGQIPDKQYYHRPYFQNTYGNTVAMYLAQKGIIPPRQWEHNKFMKNNEFINNTVAEILSSRGIIPQKQWMITKNEDKRTFKQICRNLKEYCYTYIGNQFAYNVKIITENDICQICFNDGQQKFIQTKCGQKICLQCFKQIQCQQNKSCPFCRQNDWYQKIQEEDEMSLSSSYDEDYESDESSS